MKKLLLLILLLNWVAGNSQSNKSIFIDTTSQNRIKRNNTTSDTSIYLGRTNLYNKHFEWYNQPINQYEEESIQPKTQKFKIDTIQKTEFLKYEKKYTSKINADTTKVTWTDTSFSIHTENSKINFQANKKNYDHFDYYLGFLKPLNLFMVSSIEARHEIGTLLLIDKKTGKTYFMESPFDYPCETALISPGNKLLLSYANNYYDGTSFISLLKINQKNNKYTFEDFRGLFIGRMYVSKLVWINDKSFAIAVTESDETGGSNGVIRNYLRVTF